MSPLVRSFRTIILVVAILFAGCTSDTSAPVASGTTVKKKAEPPRVEAKKEVTEERPKGKQDKPKDEPKDEPKVESAESEDDSEAEALSKPEAPGETPPEAPPIPSDRFVLLASGGPLVVDLQMTIDGKPHEEAFNELVDYVLQAADTDGDGRPTWDEVISSPRFIYGQLGNIAIDTEQAKTEILRLYDINSNKLLDRDETPRFLTRNAGGSRSFNLRAGRQYGEGGRWDAALRKVLDYDYDGALSSEELAAAPVRLASFDGNDDEIVVPSDYNSTPATMVGQMTAMQGSGPPSAIQLTERTRWAVVKYTLEEMYSYRQPLDAASFPLVPDLFGQLDADADGVLSGAEIKELTHVPPHLVLEIAFGRRANDKGETVTAASAHLASLSETLKQSASITQSEQRITLSLPAAEVVFYVNDLAGSGDFDKQAADQLAAADKDDNQYLDPEEAMMAGEGALGAFEAIDLNEDEKIYLDELRDYLRQQGAAIRNQIRAQATDDADALFAALDTDNDGRLTARELASSGERLASMDQNGNGQLNASEIPASMTVGFVRGDPQQQDRLFTPPQAARQSDAGPKWFSGMDVNGDGEISPREFLGEPDLFEKLDVNGDGFVDATEATKS